MPHCELKWEMSVESAPITLVTGEWNLSNVVQMQAGSLLLVYWVPNRRTERSRGSNQAGGLGTGT